MSVFKNKIYRTGEDRSSPVLVFFAGSSASEAAHQDQDQEHNHDQADTAASAITGPGCSVPTSIAAECAEQKQDDNNNNNEIHDETP